MDQIIKTVNLDELILRQKNYFILNWDEKDEFICSESFNELIGFSSDEISGFPYKHHSLIIDDQGEGVHNSLNKLDSDNHDQQKQIDIELVTKEGRSLWFREYVNLSNSGDGNKFSSVLFNISDFKNHELELNELVNSKTNLNESKDKLISIISHDLRAPFSSLLGFSEILLNEPNLPEGERIEFLQYIYDASDIQLQMVNHLLDWTRLQTGTMKFDPQRLDIRDIVDNCVSVLTGSTIRKDIKIIVNGDNGVFVTADERLISQVVTNLLSNAVKFTPSGKKITVTIGLFKKSMVEVVVIDEGVGIEEKYQNKLFKIDAKFTKPGTAGEKGSGFGLSLVKEIVEKHSGNIWFYSEFNKGSEFHFTLPKSEDTILILEEHEEIQKNYEKVFNDKYATHTLKFSKNGFEAINFILKKTPSALITYHSMPLMNGIQIVSSLRKKDIHNKVVVVVLVDDLSEKERAEYLELNVNTFLEVNSSPIQLLDSLKKLIL
jgi:signal transduction histidine kinase/CheY-like chemotaxis protein